MSEHLRIPEPKVPEALASIVSKVPEDDWEGLTRLRYALAVMQRQEKEPAAQPQPTGPEMSGVRTLCWHPVDRLARLPQRLHAPHPNPAARTQEANS